MTLTLLFWILMLFWLVFSVYSWWGAAPQLMPLGMNAFLFVLLVILGWAVFGAPVSGGTGARHAGFILPTEDDVQFRYAIECEGIINGTNRGLSKPLIHTAL